jgi:diketogulonate reductase-like aldo/keto reductase
MHNIIVAMLLACRVIKAVVLKHQKAVAVSMLLTWLLSAGVVVVILMSPQRFALLHLKKNRRLLQPAAQIHRHQAKYAPQQEGDSMFRKNALVSPAAR